MPPNGNDRFNAEAAAWDSNPDVHRASDGARDAILARFPQLQKHKDGGTAAQDGLDVLEIGCGTGLLSFRIAPYVRSLLAVDASTGMIDALNQKLRTQADAPKNVTPLCVMLEDPEDPSLPAATAAVSSDREGPRRKFDLILSHLVLHHIADLSALLTTMFGCLKQGGRVALTDFEDFGPEARKFHPEAKMAGVERDGVKREWFQGLLREAGFVDVKVEVGWTMEKEVERWPGEWGQKKPDGGCASMVFPFLVLEGRRP